ncbi:MAG TPA: hypothetical protein GXX49_01145 [Clostridiaceae bacterium]|jgi:mannose/cellobiose epimerase-like protein (N-acyl-D-glucosamine 2-epimerase family)|nr:hypothetical protein [Clostridiaceae bacterium]
MDSAFLNPEFWRHLALNELIPYWYKNAPDKEYGGFYTNLSRIWEPLEPWSKYPAMISRHVFGFSVAYLLSGEDKYIDIAREGVDFLLEHAWDNLYGGWFDLLQRDGKPLETTKSIPLQLYTNVGLTMYYFTTGDSRVLPYICKSIGIQKTFGHDEEFGGYYQALNRDLSVLDSSKNKHAHYGYVGSLLLNLWLATRKDKILDWECELTDITLERMKDKENGWINGYMNSLDHRWEFSPYILDNNEYIHIGAQLTAALSFIRLYQQTGKKTYFEEALKLAEKTNKTGWDATGGGWIEMVEKKPPHRHAPFTLVQNWIQNYGCFLQLHLYHLTNNTEYLDRFIKSEEFWHRYIRDTEYGGIFAAVSPGGEPDSDDRKARPWRTSYHEMEHSLLNYLYLSAYLHKQPAVLYFKLDSDEPSKKFYISLFDDPSVRLTEVKVNGRPWQDFDPEERSLTLPEGKGYRVEAKFL